MPQNQAAALQRREQWRARLRRWSDSGLSARAFAKSEGVAVGTLYAWRERLGTTSRASDCPPSSQLPARLVPVMIAPSPQAIGSVGLEIVAPDSGLVLRIPAGFSDEKLLTTVLRSLGAGQ